MWMEGATDFADAYRDIYGQTEQVAGLIPDMLRSFLKNDRGFARGRTK